MSQPHTPYGIEELPVYGRLDEIAQAFSPSSTLMLHAQPGAGKTTLVPWFLVSHRTFADKKILLLQPRRIAARAAAERIASLLGEQVGDTVGLRTRLETIISAKTRLEVITEGILTRIIQNDQSLDGYAAVIFDEFHERSIHGDLALALALDCRATLRGDLAFMLMSATLPSAEIASVFGAIPSITVPGRTFPVETIHMPPLRDEKPWDGAARLVREALKKQGDILVFLPGIREIRKTQALLERLPHDADVVILHGSCSPDEQHRALTKNGTRRRIIVATNIAETSLTIPGVTIVVDTGLERNVRFSQRTGMDHWDTTQISEASAQQRRGRAGRTSPGHCYRWWHESLRLEPNPVPEISDSDLAPLVLECAVWGSSPSGLKWLTMPPEPSVRRADALLSDLAFLSGGRITSDGCRAQKLGVHPRLARMLLDAEGRGLLSVAAVTAAILEEGDFLRGDDPDFRERIIEWKRWKQRGSSQYERALRRIDIEASRLTRLLGTSSPDESSIDPDDAGIILLSAYPDRTAMLTRSAGTGKSRFLLASGRGATVQGSLSEEEFLVAPELDGGSADGRIFLAAPVSRKDLEAGKAGAVEEQTLVEWNGWKPKARLVRRVGSIILSEKPGGNISQESAAQGVRERIIKEGVECLPWNDHLQVLRARAEFLRSHVATDIPSLTGDALAESLDDWLIPFIATDGHEAVTEDIFSKAFAYRIGWEAIRVLDEKVPESITLPSGSSRRIDYLSGDIPILAARLQEFFGCTATPEICGEPLLLHLLSPAGRPVQVTQDLDGFWDRAYPEVKKELAGRYPKHYWPENPREAEPTARAKPRK